MEDIPDGKLIPLDAYRYWPTNEYIYTGSGKTLVRFIFYKVVFTEAEYHQLNLFKSHIKSQNPDLILPEFFSDEELLRVILGCKYDIKKAYAALINSISWRSINLINSFYTLLPFCKELLNSGSIYFHGRDHRFRPLLILNVERFNLKQYSSVSYSYLLCFLLEFAIQKLMIPGQIENWIVITDLNSKGLTKLPLNDMKKVIKTLQDNFRCRMSVNYVVNAPTSLRFMWGMIKNFIEEHTIKKIKILKESEPQEMKAHFAQNQVERKYGGCAPNLTTFWPPCFPTTPYEVEGDSSDKYLGSENTYHIYNQAQSIDVLSDIIDVSERITIALPNSSINYQDFGEDVPDNLTSLGRNNSNEEWLKATESEKYYQEVENKFSEKTFELNHIDSINNHLSIDIDMKEAPDEKNSIPRASITTVIDDSGKEPQTPTRASRFCKFCSNKGCVII